MAGEIRSAVCNNWLKPIDMKEHPTFSSWVIYGTLSSSPLCIRTAADLTLGTCDMTSSNGMLTMCLPGSVRPEVLAQSACEVKVCGKAHDMLCVSRIARPGAGAAGEEAGVHGLASELTGPSFRLDMDGISFSHVAAASTVSPVFSLWLTFVLMYIGELQDILKVSCQSSLHPVLPLYVRVLTGAVVVSNMHG